MAAQQKYIKLSSGHSIPALGLGTWQSLPGEVFQAVKDAIKVGYRQIDCAHVYGNQVEVAKAIAESIKEGTVKRQDLFITGKVWNTFHSFDNCTSTIDVNVHQLGLDYLDLMLIHWPFGYKENEGMFPKNEDGTFQHSPFDYLDTWRAMEEAVYAGKIRSIGISNFNCQQTKRLLENCRIKPVTNQVECNPYLAQKELKKLSENNGIVLTSYSPLSSAGSKFRKEGQSFLLEEPLVIKLAADRRKTPAQVVIRWALQRGTVCIPKSVKSDRIEENFNVWKFKLTPEEMSEIDSLDKHLRINVMNGNEGSQFYPFHDEY